MINITLKLLKL